MRHVDGPPAAATATLAEGPFPAGVASFDPTPDGVLIWTATTAPGPCSWEVAGDDAFAQVVAAGTEEVAAPAGTVCVEVGGLEPGRRYWYRFTVAGATSPVGRTRTLPDRPDARLRIGVTCCARFGQARFDAYRWLALADVDVVVHLGDYVYEDTKSDIEDRAPEPDHDCVTSDDYRRRHLQCRADPDLQLLHARHPMVVVWDDHDIADNASREGAANHDEARQGPWADRLAAALAVHHEMLPKRLADPDDVTSAWRSLRAGDLLHLVCAETRAHRDAPAGTEGTRDAADPDRTILGPAQRAWLQEAASDPAPRWTVVLSGTVVSELTVEAPDALDGVLPEKYAVEDGRARNTDQWDGYQADRALLVDALRRRGGASLVLSGDIHSSWVLDGPADDAGPVAVELTCPPSATTPIGQLLPAGAGARFAAAARDALPGVRWVDADHRGYLVLDVAEDLVQASYWWVGADRPHGEWRPARLGRRWDVVAGFPARSVDVEPPGTWVDGPGAIPSRHGVGRRAARGAAAAAGVVAVVGAVAGGVALRRRGPGPRT